MSSKKAIIVQVYNLFNPSKDRQIERRTGGFTIQDWIDDNPVVLTYPIVCLVNGKAILRKEWMNFVVKSNDIVIFNRLPQGGGGGGKNPLLAIAGIALAVTGSIFTGGILSVGLVGLGTGLAIVGSGLLGVPEIPSIDQIPQASPTYSISAQGNTARLGQAIPVVYGRNKIYLDFASAPYSTFDNNEQYLHHVMVIGQGEYDLHEVLIEDTPISNFKEIQYQKVEPNGSLTLFTDNVVTAVEVSGQELDRSSNTDEWVGPFLVNPSNTLAEKIEVDIVLPKGLYTVDDDGNLQNNSVSFKVQIRSLNSNGQYSNWIDKNSYIITDDSNTPIRKTYDIGGITPGVYQIRLARTSEKNNTTTNISDLHWNGAKAYLRGDVDYSGLTVLAVKMRATDNLSSRSSRKINCIVTRKLPKWNPNTGWSANTNTSSVVWALADAIKSSSYGANWKDDNIDLQGLYELDQVLTARGDEFNGVFDRKMSMWEALKLICRAGRSAGILQGGVFKAVRDREQTIPVAMFSTRNIVKDTFSISYAMASEDTVNGVTVEYINPDTWQVDEVSVDHDGNTPTNPAKVKLFGCTNSEQARREGIYLARNNIYRRKTIKLTTELEGYIPTFGDLVVVSHDMPQWGISGDIIGFDPISMLCTLSEPIQFEDGQTHYIIFRTKKGGVSGPWIVEQGSDDYHLDLGVSNWDNVSSNDEYTTMTHTQENETVRLYYGTKEERTHFSFGILGQFNQYGVIKAIRPRGELKVELQILSEDERVHEY